MYFLTYKISAAAGGPLDPGRLRLLFEMKRIPHHGISANEDTLFVAYHSEPADEIKRNADSTVQAAMVELRKFARDNTNELKMLPTKQEAHHEPRLLPNDDEEEQTL